MLYLPAGRLNSWNYLLVEYFDREENATGSLTAALSENPQKVNGLAGVTLGV